MREKRVEKNMRVLEALSVLKCYKANPSKGGFLFCRKSLPFVEMRQREGGGKGVYFKQMVPYHSNRK